MTLTGESAWGPHSLFLYSASAGTGQFPQCPVFSRSGHRTLYNRRADRSASRLNASDFLIEELTELGISAEP